MNYRETMEYIEGFQGLGSVLGLDNMRELMAGLSNPQDELRIIHLAGTNGKGSVAAYISSALKKAGYKTGVYASPSVFSYLEKIRIGGRNISQKSFAAIMSEVSKVADKMKTHPTVFEMETAAAFLYFAREKCDYVVLECGMGGDLDATNIVSTTILSVITSISLDHTAVLGKTLEQIAEKKAGIIKQGVPVVTSNSSEDVQAVIRKRAKALDSSLYIADTNEANIKVIKDSFLRTVFSIKDEKLEEVMLEISMAGAHQLENAYLSYRALKILGIDEKYIHSGLKSAVNKGRMTMLLEKPMLIIDGAHNPDAARRLYESVTKYFPKKRMIFIMGVLADKDYEEVCHIMAPLAAQIITLTPPQNPRSLPAIDLARCVMQYNNNVSVAASVEEALEMALLFAEKKDMILAFGSLSYLGRLKDAVERI